MLSFSMIDVLSLPSGWCNAELLMSQSFVDENSFFSVFLHYTLAKVYCNVLMY